MDRRKTNFQENCTQAHAQFTKQNKNNNEMQSELYCLHGSHSHIAISFSSFSFEVNLSIYVSTGV